MAQQRKRKAIEHLIQNKKQLAQQKEDRQEQAMFDEVALQKFVRSQR
jgi:flagellar biosynthesis chaperone FliJ